MNENFKNGSVKVPKAAKEYVSSSSTLTEAAQENINISSTIKTEDSNYITDWSAFFRNIKWPDTIGLIMIHVITIWAILNAPYIEKWKGLFWVVGYGMLPGFGVTAGAHRYWTHRTFKANTALKIILTLLFVSAGQNTIQHWARDHRAHHKWSETDADPYNSRRGFFFSHVGWLMLRKHPQVLQKGKTIDMSDITSDPVAIFTEKYYMPLTVLLVFVLPTILPVLLWNESIFWSGIGSIGRYTVILNITWCVNSFAHIIGTKPYDKNIYPVENRFVGYVTFGEGWHNYHHVFPYDYRAAELGGDRANVTTRFIDFFAKIGWAYDLKTPSESIVHNTIVKKGDGTHELAETLAKKLKMENVENISNESSTKGY